VNNPIDRAKAHSHAVYLKDGTTSTVKAIDDLVDLAEDLAAKLNNLINAAEEITPTEEEFLDGKAVIDQDDWDDWDDAIDEAKAVLDNNNLE